MNVIDLIKRLKELGHEVKFFHRKDGGYVITKIDGHTYSGKSGNKTARLMLGEKLSQARSVQLARIRLPKGKKAVKQEAIPQELEKMLKKTQREWRKTHPDIRGTISKRGLRYFLREEGYEKAKASLDRAWRYTQGYAYLENVQYLIQRIQADLYKKPSNEMQSVIDAIKVKEMTFKEEWIQHCYDAIYEWEKGVIDGDECARRIMAIIG